MRYYSQRRTVRVMLTVLWLAIGVFWVDVLLSHHDARRWFSIVWIVLPIVQISTLWAYWELTATELRHWHPFFRGPRLLLSTLIYAGALRRGGWISRHLRKSTEVEFSGRAPMYVTVQQGDRLRVQLQRALPGPPAAT